MKNTTFLKQACRHCSFYQPEGRRGGVCGKLNVPVDSNWEACILASSPFPNFLNRLDEIAKLETDFAFPFSGHRGSNPSKATSEINT